MGKPKEKKEEYSTGYLGPDNGPSARRDGKEVLSPHGVQTDATTGHHEGEEGGGFEKTISIRFTKEDHDRIKRYFWEKHRLTVSAGIRYAVVEWIREHD